MKHIKSVARIAPVKARICISIPVIPGSAAIQEFKSALGFEVEETGLLGAIQMCKG